MALPIAAAIFRLDDLDRLWVDFANEPFTDLVGFTTLAELLGEKSVGLLNEYMGRMVPHHALALGPQRRMDVAVGHEGVGRRNRAYSVRHSALARQQQLSLARRHRSLEHDERADVHVRGLLLLVEEGGVNRAQPVLVALRGHRASLPGVICPVNPGESRL